MSRPDRSQQKDREKFVVPIKCACGQVGAAFWEEKLHRSPEGPMPVLLLEVSSGFYLLDRTKGADRAEIMCAACESVVLD